MAGQKTTMTVDMDLSAPRETFWLRLKNSLSDDQAGVIHGAQPVGLTLMPRLSLEGGPYLGVGRRHSA
jgi:hypothetical protein